MGAILSGTLCPSSISLIASSMVISSCIMSPFMAKSAVCACMILYSSVHYNILYEWVQLWLCTSSFLLCLSESLSLCFLLESYSSLSSLPPRAEYHDYWKER